ncbi:hypothetical protein PR048_008435 [Dryococelus australis]|uniref:Uncharacterized protein n=1 Tax=Dryococelus australis TaxID=614101 RepID=A0ABQ9HX47_9NEOP|nr:hypothetical protein PR048_008435 [Dryococelus australis]
MTVNVTGIGTNRSNRRGNGARKPASCEQRPPYFSARKSAQEPNQHRRIRTSFELRSPAPARYAVVILANVTTDDAGKLWRSGNDDSQSGGHGFDSRSGNPDFGYPRFSEITSDVSRLLHIIAGPFTVSSRTFGRSYRTGHESRRYLVIPPAGIEPPPPHPNHSYASVYRWLEEGGEGSRGARAIAAIHRGRTSWNAVDSCQVWRGGGGVVYSRVGKRRPLVEWERVALLCMLHCRRYRPARKHQLLHRPFTDDKKGRSSVDLALPPRVAHVCFTVFPSLLRRRNARSCRITFKAKFDANIGLLAKRTSVTGAAYACRPEESAQTFQELNTQSSSVGAIWWRGRLARVEYSACWLKANWLNGAVTTRVTGLQPLEAPGCSWDLIFTAFRWGFPVLFIGCPFITSSPPLYSDSHSFRPLVPRGPVEDAVWALSIPSLLLLFSAATKRPSLRSLTFFFGMRHLLLFLGGATGKTFGVHTSGTALLTCTKVRSVHGNVSTFEPTFEKIHYCPGGRSLRGYRGRGGVVVRLLASHQGEHGFDSRRGCSGTFACEKSCRTMPLIGGFSRVSPVSLRICIPALLNSFFT